MLSVLYPNTMYFTPVTLTLLVLEVSQDFLGGSPEVSTDTLTILFLQFILKYQRIDFKVFFVTITNSDILVLSRFPLSCIQYVRMSLLFNIDFYLRIYYRWQSPNPYPKIFFLVLHSFLSFEWSSLFTQIPFSF